jgi:hypothetical protein
MMVVLRGTGHQEVHGKDGVSGTRERSPRISNHMYLLSVSIGTHNDRTWRREVNGLKRDGVGRVEGESVASNAKHEMRSRTTGSRHPAQKRLPLPHRRD